jgi:serine/threonine-protein kinase
MGLQGNDPPTVLSGSGSGTGPGTGSSARRIWVAGGAGSLPYPEPGQRIDSFELEEPIGVGGMGAVFRTRDARLDRLVALKLLPPEQAGDPEVVQRFYQEGRAAAQLDHENIARVYTIGHDANFHYIAFEYIEGTTIRQRVERNGPLPVSEAINYTLQIAGALVHATERGVVHRDIKPSNIIVTPQGRAKLVDMGLARRFERGNDDGLTQSGMTLGTFDYISPEQARD